MKFKCKATNLIYNFEFEADIASMLKHPDYEEVPDKEVVGKSEEVPTETTKPVKTPSKKPKVTQDEANING
jgi:hypothetical protein